jgi:hypothetical protein
LAISYEVLKCNLFLYSLRGGSLPLISAGSDKSHVHYTREEGIRSFHDIFVVLQCFAKHPLSLQVGTPHFTHPNVVLRLFGASLLLQLPDISPNTALFRFLTGGSVQTEQYRCGSCDASSWCCNSGSGLVSSVCTCFGGIRALLERRAFCRSTRNRNRRTSL